MFNHDAAAPTTGGGYSLIPDGTYELQIIDFKEGTSRAGHNMVNITCEVINNQELNGAKVFHNVTFLPKETNGKPTPGAGMSSHFLKSINQSYEGGIVVDPIAWVGEKFKAKVGTREYTNKRDEKVKTNDIKEISPIDDLPF